MSLKSAARLAHRIIKMVESGDYDPDMIEHMVESLVKNRDRKIKFLTSKSKPRTFDWSVKSISAGLRETIKTHGDITPELIGSASKRIYGHGLRVEHKPKPVSTHDITDPNITIIRDKTATHKLTVAGDGNVRIKVAKGTDPAEANLIIRGFIEVAMKALPLRMSTLRGKVKPSQTGNSITLYTDSKNQSVAFTY